jgi:molybdopterin-biosynthesis enzyme MoeA-like protein
LRQSVWIQETHQEQNMKQPTNFTLLIVGDEILSGKRQDRHLAHVQGLLAARGLELSGVQIIGDDQHRLAEAIHAAKVRGDVLLSCGGIGGTPDDCTRQAAAQAWGVPLVRHPEGIKLLEARYGEKTYPNRILMVEFPENAARFAQR